MKKRPTQEYVAESNRVIEALLELARLPDPPDPEEEGDRRARIKVVMAGLVEHFSHAYVLFGSATDVIQAEVDAAMRKTAAGSQKRNEPPIPVQLSTVSNLISIAAEKAPPATSPIK